MNSATIGALMIVGVVILYIFALYYVEEKIARQEKIDEVIFDKLKEDSLKIYEEQYLKD